MPSAPDQPLVEALLDSWDRSNAILVNLLRAVPEQRLAIRAMEGSPSIAQLFTHIHYVRLVFVQEDAPEFAIKTPEEEWSAEFDSGRIEQMLNESARTVRDAVKGPACGRAGNGCSLRPPDPLPAAHDLARGLSSRTDQAGAEAGGLSAHKPRGRADLMARLDE